MAIKNIPAIIGPDFGGVIYGLNLQVGYSGEPSKLIIDIVNETGVYPPPALNSQVQISFGTFVFDGIIWSYNIKQTAQERLLQIEIIDNSIILDRYYVLLWKRGLFNDNGTGKTIRKEFNLSDEKVLIPKIESFQRIIFEEKSLKNQFVERKIYSAGKIKDNIIYLGTEDFPTNTCDIPDTNYTFDDLNNLIKNIVGTFSFKAPTGYKASHEGKLRDVLRAWAADCGLDFYWNFSTNKIEVFPSGKGINVILPTLNFPELIESSESRSIEGTFAQHAIGYVAYPKEDLKTLNQSVERTLTTQLNALNVSYFLKRNGTLQSLNLPKSKKAPSNDPSAAERNLWGGREEDEFLACAFLGYIDEELRDLYAMKYNFWGVLGFGICDEKGSAPSFTTREFPILPETIKTKIIDELNAVASEDIKELKQIDDDKLTNYNFLLGVKDENLNSKWKTIEQEILSSYGSAYYHTIGKSSNAFYCTPKYVVEVNTSVDPEPDQNEPMSKEFDNLKIYRRSGTMSHAQDQAANLLNLNDSTNREKISKIRLREFDIITTGLKTTHLPLTKATTLIIAPNKKLIDKYLRKFEVTPIAQGINKLEPTINDIASSSNNKNKCDSFEEAIKKSQCVDSRSEAVDKAYKEIFQQMQNNTNSPVAGLISARAKGSKIEIFGQELKIYAPSNSRFQAVINISINIEKISDKQNLQKIFFNSAGPTTANRVAEMDVIYDNITDGNDEFGTQRKESIPLAQGILNDSPREIYKLVFAGEPPVGLNLSPRNGISSLDISYSSDGFKTTVEFASKPPKRIPIDTFLRKTESQFNRRSFNAT